MVEQGRSAKEALECAEAIMKGDGKRTWAVKMSEYIGEWNTLTLYLGWRTRLERESTP